MDESAHPNKPPVEPPTPEVDQLLKMLEVQAALRRGGRERGAAAGSGFQTPTFRYGSLIAIAVFTFGSLGLLEWLLSQMPKPAHSAGTLVPAPSTLSVGKSAETSAAVKK